MNMTLIEAIKENNEKEFFEILKLKTDSSGKKFIDEVDSVDGGSLLYWAAACGHIHFIDPLITAGANINKADNRGWTPVYATAYFGHAEIISILKAAGADVNTLNDSGTTPVCAAVYTGGAEAITALKAAGANVDTPEINGLTPIYIAVQMRDIKVISALLEVGANVNTKTPHGTPLELAKQGTTQRDQDILRLLEIHLQQYPNGIKTLVANRESTQLNQEPAQEDFATQVLQYDNPNVEAKAGRDVVTITGGVRGPEIAIGGGNSSSTEASQNSSESNPKEAPEADNIAILKQLKLFFMSNKYKASESPDCELYNRVLDSHKAILVYIEEERIHRLFVNNEPLESQNAIKMLSKMIAALQPLNTQNTNTRLNAARIVVSSGNTQVQACAGRDVITITGGVTSRGGLRIGGGDTYHNLVAYNQFKNQTAGQYSITGVVNNSGNMQLGNGNTQNNKSITLP
jgi:hypothetical protein